MVEEKKDKVVYLIGSLKNRKVIDLAKKLRENFPTWEVFDDWISPGPEADDFWRDYEKERGSTYKQALGNWAGKHIFEFDKHHLDRANIGVLYMPCGRSGHLELGYLLFCKCSFNFFQKTPPLLYILISLLLYTLIQLHHPREQQIELQLKGIGLSCLSFFKPST